MTDKGQRIVKSDLVRKLLWIVAVAILLSPFFPAAIRILGEQSELRGQIAESQVALVKHYFDEE